MPDELWKPIPDFALYEATSQGRIRGVRSGLILVGTSTRWGGRQYSLREERRRKVAFGHRLVVAAFLGPAPEGNIVRHRNGDKLDNRHLLRT
jgi:hypothetical protein